MREQRLRDLFKCHCVDWDTPGDNNIPWCGRWLSPLSLCSDYDAYWHSVSQDSSFLGIGVCWSVCLEGEGRIYFKCLAWRHLALILNASPQSKKYVGLKIKRYLGQHVGFYNWCCPIDTSQNIWGLCQLESPRALADVVSISMRLGARSKAMSRLQIN